MISHVISPWSVTWSVDDQPRDQCMISHKNVMITQNFCLSLSLDDWVDHQIEVGQRNTNQPQGSQYLAMFWYIWNSELVSIRLLHSWETHCCIWQTLRALEAVSWHKYCMPWPKHGQTRHGIPRGQHLPLKLAHHSSEDSSSPTNMSFYLFIFNLKID